MSRSDDLTAEIPRRLPRKGARLASRSPLAWARHLEPPPESHTDAEDGTNQPWWDHHKDTHAHPQKRSTYANTSEFLLLSTIRSRIPFCRRFASAAGGTSSVEENGLWGNGHVTRQSSGASRPRRRPRRHAAAPQLAPAPATRHHPAKAPGYEPRCLAKQSQGKREGNTQSLLHPPVIRRKCHIK